MVDIILFGLKYLNNRDSLKEFEKSFVNNLNIFSNKRNKNFITISLQAKVKCETK